jgi:hypothetical protein
MRRLTAPQLRKLRYIAEHPETRNPGDLATTYSLVTRGLVEATKHGTFPRAFMTYRVTDEGATELER